MSTNAIEGEKEEKGKEGSYKKVNLFFIKSKHAFQNYKNHDYFEDQLKKSRPQ